MYQDILDGVHQKYTVTDIHGSHHSVKIVWTVPVHCLSGHLKDWEVVKTTFNCLRSVRLYTWCRLT